MSDAERLAAVLAYIADWGCSCDKSFYYASLICHEPGCLMQIQHLLTGDNA